MSDPLMRRHPDYTNDRVVLGFGSAMPASSLRLLWLRRQPVGRPYDWDAEMEWSDHE